MALKLGSKTQMNIALLLLLYTHFVINFYQTVCTMAPSPFLLKHITSLI